MELQIFKNVRFGEMHGYLDERGTAWLNVEDVARGLGIVQIKDGVAYVRIERINGYLQEFNFPRRVGKNDFIPENMVYRLAMKAKNETAEDFQAWLADEVVPSLRKYGYYSIDHCKEIANNPEILIQVGLILKAEKEKVAKLETENAVLTQQVAELTPKATYSDLILQCKDVIPISVIAKDYGLSAKRLNKLLNKFGVQYKINGTWLLYQKYAKLGWTRTKTYNYNENCSKVLTYWTQQGRFALYGILKQNGYLPNIEKA